MYMHCFVNRSFIHCYIQLKQRLSKESILYTSLGCGRKIPRVTNGCRADHQNMRTYQTFKEIISQHLPQVLTNRWTMDGLMDS